MIANTLSVGDLVTLSAFGRAVIKPNKAKVAIVVSGPYEKDYICAKTGMYNKYFSYDVMLGTELLKDIPEDFIQRMGDDNHEDNPQGLEEILDRSLKKRSETE